MSLAHKLAISGLVSAIAAICTINPADAVSLYSVTDLGDFRPLDINDSGQIIGISDNQNLLWENGNFTNLTNIGATAINNNGQIVGVANNRLFLRQTNGDINSFTAPVCFSTFPCPYVRAYDLNDRGQILTTINDIPVAGNDYLALNLLNLDGTLTEISSSFDPVNRLYNATLNNESQVAYSSIYRYGSNAFVWDNGVNTELSFPDRNPNLFSYARANDLNEQGKVVGWTGYLDYNPYTGISANATLWENPLDNPNGGIDLGTLGGIYSVANAINNLDQIVGTSDTSPSSDLQAFLWEEGTMFNLNNLLLQDLDFDLSEAYLINNKEQIVASSNVNGENRYYLLTPTETVPEPSSILSLLAFGSLGVASSLLKRK
ncbi:MAG: PEP-CTERM sorting domain-containing protein [Oscillatoria sp. PMC 1051.18]|nr:PEP-CTERM sorting domain-containing protein [Oscillatoria sp. PMC 1050.18]MEC5028905.1 PEP-CTERM sorting domain-containing protein [Oscillatoria sp. PMC 1051.18]